MKKYLAVLSCMMIVILSCQKKSVPVISERSTKTETLKMMDTATVIADTVRGHVVFTNRCGRCHGLPEPVLYTVKRWEMIMDNMASRARLSKADRVHVTAWVNLNAKP